MTMTNQAADSQRRAPAICATMQGFSLHVTMRCGADDPSGAVFIARVLFEQCLTHD